MKLLIIVLSPTPKDPHFMFYYFLKAPSQHSSKGRKGETERQRQWWTEMDIETAVKAAQRTVQASSYFLLNVQGSCSARPWSLAKAVDWSWVSTLLSRSSLDSSFCLICSKYLRVLSGITVLCLQSFGICGKLSKSLGYIEKHCKLFIIVKDTWWVARILKCVIQSWLYPFTGCTHSPKQQSLIAVKR